MKLNNFYSKIFLSGLIAGLSGCHSPVQTSSNLDVSAGDARANLDLRLRESADIKRKLIKISEALKPLNELLQTLNGSLRSNSSRLQIDVDGQSLDRLTEGSLEDLEWPRRILKMLQQASEGLVDHRPDGGWILSRDIHDLTFRNVATGELCSESKAILEGGRSQGVDRFTVSIRDCANPAPRVLGSAEISNGEIRFEFHPISIEQGMSREVSLGNSSQCMLSVRSSQQSSVICQAPIIKSIGNFTLRIDKLELFQTRDGTRGSLKALVLRNSGNREEAGHFDVQALPGQPFSVALDLP